MTHGIFVVMIALLACGVGRLTASDDPLPRFAFVDARARALADFSGQTVVVQYFCGHCPSATEYLGSATKTVHDAIESRHLPVWLVLVTPDFSGAELAALDGERHYGMSGALYANDAENPLQVGLKNIRQLRVYTPDGQEQRFGGSVDELIAVLSQPAAGTPRYAKPASEDAKLIALWWAVERGRPGAMKALSAAAAKKSPQQEGAVALLTDVKAALATREAAAVAAPLSLAAYEALEQLVRDADGFDLKAAVARAKELAKDKTVKDELSARAAYQKCQALLASPKPSLQQDARAGLVQIAQRFPATVYGQRAAKDAGVVQLPPKQ